ncbi:hypothetical protein IJG78_00920 [Candidatus Saccharibacteria bacterium]|nr:hypothetical protein [Candidatus Saccharibacteria bacterium]
MDNNDINTNSAAPVDAAADINVDLTDDKTIDLFIEGIMEEKGISSESEELKQDIFADLKTRLLEEIDRSLVAALPDEKLDELSKIVASEGQVAPETVGKMVEEAKLDVEEIVGVTMARFRELYLGEDAENAEPIEADAASSSDTESGNANVSPVETEN